MEVLKSMYRLDNDLRSSTENGQTQEGLCWLLADKLISNVEFCKNS